ncbi:prepilin peptidase, partial [Patescibacteria group bacterium]|nr:prepilin peptidase [Patescibacteria group bacterium]
MGAMFVFLSNAWPLELVFLGLFALVIGSFVGALTYRIPKGVGFLKGRSFCDKCKKSLPWYTNIPIFSYIFLKGKSLCCGKKISPRYPLIELTSFLGAVFLYFLFPVFSLFIIYYSLFIVLLAILVIDLEHQFIPDELSWLVLFLFFLSPIYNILYLNLFAGFLFSLFLLLIHLITRGRGMGLGDVKLAIALGTWLGLRSGLMWLSSSFIIGGIVALILLLLKRAR